MSAKTLLEGYDASLSSESCKSETLIPKQQDSAVGAHENGVRVSETEDSSLRDEVKNGVFEDEILGGTSSGDPNNGGVLGGFAEQNRVVDSGGGNETVKGLDSVFEVEKNGENGGEKMGSGGDSTGLIEDGSHREVTFDKNGISLFVEVRGCVESKEKDGVEVQNGSLDEKEREKTEIIAGENIEYSAGDLVWGKIRSHPWWPGQIYNVSDASEHATIMNKQRGDFLVAFFDGSFSWCSSSQLQHFVEKFEENSKQSSTKGFVSAVRNALDEIGRLVELQMTCSCMPEDIRIGLARPLAVNAGIKEGVCVPAGGIGKLSIPQLESAEIVSTLRDIAQVVSVSSMLDLTVLKSWLSAFYRAKGGYQLAVFREPSPIEGLEDEERSLPGDLTDVIDPVEVPVEGMYEADWVSAPVAVDVGFDGISLDKLYQRRKEKSVAELMGEDMDVEPENQNGGTVKEVTVSGILASSHGREKMRSIDKKQSQGPSDLVQPSSRKRGRKKKDEILGSPRSPGNKVTVVDNVCKEGKVEANNGASALVSPSSRKRGRKKKEEVLGSSLSAENNGASDLVSPSSRKRGRKKKEEILGSSMSAENNGASDLVSPSSRKRGRKKKEEILGSSMSAENNGASDLVSPSSRKRGRKKKEEILGSSMSAENNVTGVDNGCKEEKVETEKGTEPEEGKKNNVSGFEDDDGKANGSNRNVFTSRERKKSKYLSPPFTSITWKGKGLSPENSETDSVKAAKGARVGERMARVAGLLIGSPPIVKCSGETFQKKHFKKHGSCGEASALSSSQTPKKDQKIIDPVKINASANEVLKEVRLAALSPFYMRENKSLDIISGFVSTFRSSIYLHGSSYKMYHNGKPGRKSKSLNSKPEAQGKDLYPTNFESPESGLQAKKEKSGRAKSNMPKSKSSAGGNSSSSPKRRNKTSEKFSSSHSSADEVSGLIFVRQKLEMMTSMLENSEMSAGMKSDLEAEMKLLLEKVSTMTESTSS